MKYVLILIIGASCLVSSKAHADWFGSIRNFVANAVDTFQLAMHKFKSYVHRDQFDRLRVEYRDQTGRPPLGIPEYP